jgi:hypothetical protein
MTTEERTCCSIKLNNDFNCIENCCEASLINYAKMCYLCNIGQKYITIEVIKADNRSICNNYCKECSIPFLAMSPLCLLVDILICPCKTVLYCEKCLEKKDEVITEQPKA